MFRSTPAAALTLIALIPFSVGAEDPVEELPPPVAANQAPEEVERDRQDASDVTGWGLTGPRGRYYFFGPTATADYWRERRQSIVQLEQEEESQHARPDPQFLYYREIGTGHRWAFGRQPTAQDEYVIYFQPAAGKPSWIFFQKARLHREADGQNLIAEAPAVVAPGCGGEKSILLRAP